MGSEQTKLHPAADLYLFMDYKYCRVWVGKPDKVEHFEQYPVQALNDNELQTFRNMFFLRMCHSYFPNTLYFIAGPDAPFCSLAKAGSIILQRIPYRLCQFTNILYNEAPSLLITCLRGYQQLHKHYGVFKVRSTMIGFDRAYRMKLWHHPDLSNPTPEDPFINTTSEMIEEIIKCIENACAYPYNIPRFSEFLQLQRITLLSFDAAIKEVENFAEYYSIRLLDSFPSIEKYLKLAEGVTPLSNRIFHCKSTEKLELIEQERIKNRSLNKFSFKNNQVVGMDPISLLKEMGRPQLLPTRRTSTSTGVNQNLESSTVNQQVLATEGQTRNMVRQIEISSPRPRIIESKCQSPYQKLERQDNNTTMFMTNPSRTNFEDYGLMRPQDFSCKVGTLHTRTESRNEPKDGRRQIEIHKRTVSDIRHINQQMKPYSPYIETTETREGENSTSRSVKTTKTIQSGESSLVVEDDHRYEAGSMIRNRGEEWMYSQKNL